MSKFVLIIPQGTAEHAQIIHHRFPETRAAWWHWSADVWLLHLVSENPTIDQFRDEIRASLPNVNFIALKVDVSTLSGYGPKEWQDWVSKFWPR